MTYSAAWDALTESQKDAFKRRMPFYRTGMAQPSVNGYLVDDKTYAAGGRALCLRGGGTDGIEQGGGRVNYQSQDTLPPIQGKAPTGNWGG